MPVGRLGRAPGIAADYAGLRPPARRQDTWFLDRLRARDCRAGIIAECDYDSLTEAAAADEDEQTRIPDASESDVLRELMRSSGRSQIQLVKEVGISQSTLSAILNGEREMTKGHMVALARFFNVPPAVFLPS